MLHNNQGACNRLPPGGPWDTSGCGTALLMDRTSYDDFIEFLPERFHEDVFVYDNDRDVRAWLKRYTGERSTDSLVELSSERLMDYVHSNHSYKNRAERIIEWSTEQKILS